MKDKSRIANSLRTRCALGYLVVALSNHRRKLFCAIAMAVVCGWTAVPTRADIYQWELDGWYHQPSNTPCAGGSGVCAEPYANLSGLDLTQAYLAWGFGNLTGADLRFTNLTNAWADWATLTSADLLGANLNSAWLNNAMLDNANLSYADLTNAYLGNTTLTNADFTFATVAGANLSYTSLTSSQLYSTASYQTQNLNDIVLSHNYMTGWNFAGQNLARANLTLATLTNADLTGAILNYATLANAVGFWANLSGAKLTYANLASADLRYATLTSADLTNANLTHTDLSYADLTGADLSSGTLTGAYLYGAKLTNAKLANADLAGADLIFADLDSATLTDADLTSATLVSATLTGADLTYANLTGANLSSGTLTNANFTGANVAEANLSHTFLTSSQLYSTASYQAKDLHGIFLSNNDMTSWNLSGQDLTGADLGAATLTNASLTLANLTGAYLSSTTLTNASLTNADLTNADLYSATLTNANLTGANLYLATVTNADFTGATVAAVNFSNTSLTPSQLYSTASYKAKDLHGIRLALANLAGWNFAGENLTDAWLFSATLTNTNLTGANLTGASLVGTDLRGASGFVPGSATTTNAIFPDGTITGLNLTAANSWLIVRDYSGASQIPIRVTEGMTVSSTGTLLIQLQGNWGSTISFDPGIPVILNGNLALGVAAGIDPAGLVGTDFRVFNWTGVSPGGQFTLVSDLPVGLSWNTSGLYTTGHVVLTGSPQPVVCTAGGGTAAVGGIQATFSEAQMGTLTGTYSVAQTPDELQQVIGSAAANQINFALPGNQIQAWDVSYSGEFFGTAVLVFHYDPSLIGGTPETALGILHFENGSWVLPPGEAVDINTHTIMVPTDGFSPFALSVVPEPSTFALLGVGILSLGVWVWRKRTKVR